MTVRQSVQCSQCGNDIFRVIWNYAKKRPIAEFFCNNTCKGQWQTEQREKLGFTREWLIGEYCDKRRSANAIAKEIGRDSKRVWEWLRDYGIDTRSRGTDYGQNFKPGMIGSFTGKKHTEETKRKLSAIAIADRRVPFDPNIGSFMKGRKGKDTPSWRGGITPDRQAFYSSKEWSDAVKIIWKRDNAKCKRCGKHRNDAEHRGTFHIHHIVSFMVKELRAVPGNLVLLCDKCHRFVHSKKNSTNEFLKG